MNNFYETELIAAETNKQTKKRTNTQKSVRGNEQIGKVGEMSESM